MNSEENISKLIHPWKAFHDDRYKRNYYYNSETNETSWALPEDILARVRASQEKKDDEEEDGEESEDEKPAAATNMEKFLGAGTARPGDSREHMSRPARKQVERSLATEFAYRQGDEEYNIWYDKFLTDKKEKDREAALTRCDPEKDAGFTKADMMERYSAYFCLHFARGCCCEGANCRFYHHLPSQEECQGVDQVKDVFGRTRFATAREDNGGIGSFMKESRTLHVADFRMPSGNDPLRQMYEMLWRHFSVWGQIEDIHLFPNRGIAYIRYAHRCMAEFAKEAMMHQALDASEILTVKWGDDNAAPETGEKEAREIEAKIEEKLQEGRRRKRVQKEAKVRPEAQYFKHTAMYNTSDNRLVEKKKKEIAASCDRMMDVLQRIEEHNDDVAVSVRVDLPDTGLSYSVPPELNNMPLFTK